MAIRKKYQGQALGRGLDALLNTDAEVQTAGSSNICEVSVEKIQPNPNQPRRDFDDDSLQELANSIRQIGIIQPITLRDMGNGTYTIIAGERRWRASQRAGLTHIPAYIRTVDDENMMEMALVENIQRQDLTALEIALAYQHLLEQYDLTQDRLSERVGKKRATITNYLRLLKLPASIQMALQNRELDMGHARALLTLDNPSLQLKVFSQIQREHLSVRKVEELVKRLSSGEAVNIGGQKVRQQRAKLSRDYELLRDNLSRCFQTKVQFACNDQGKGKITIPFSGEEELERIVALLDKLKH